MTDHPQRLTLHYIISEDFAAGIRADKYLAEQSGDFTRSQLKQRIARLVVNDKEVKLSRKVFPGDRITVEQIPLPPQELRAEDIPLDILYEDDAVVVLNKPAGLVVHPGCGNAGGTLVNALLFHYENLQQNFAGDQLRPGIVHRLDKDTSGVLLTAKSSRAHELLSAQFRHLRVKKNYLALVKGSPPRQEDTIELALKRDAHHRKKFTVTEKGGKSAVTHYRVIKFFEGYTLLLLTPRTGRTHQLRVHMQYIGCPVLGDPVYSRRDIRFPEIGLLLHAWRISIKLPSDGVTHTFIAPLPERFYTICRLLGWEPDEERWAD